jgi:hypothetical protein
MSTAEGSTATTKLKKPKPGFIHRGFMAAAQAIDHRIGWDKLPKTLGVLVLVGLRDKLRLHNLHDTNVAPSQNLPPVDPYTSAVLTARTPDGTYNDLSEPRMGMARARFGRNIPLDKAWPETGARLMTPNPRTVSRRVMTRNEFIPATKLNTLAATWIQFMVKDWIGHGHGDFTRAFKPALEPDDRWPEPELVIPATIADPTGTDDTSFPPAFVNEHSAWWDGSVIYGDSLAQQKFLRSGNGGKLKVSGRLPAVLTDPDIDASIDPAQVPGFWTGLALMGVLFCLEHNSICDALAAENPHWDDEELFQRARLVISALIAKIHTVEWTPGILSHPTTVAALRANWYGLAGQKIRDAVGRISSSDAISGITGGSADHFGVPYSLTEEFSIVYRMHPLIPDDYEIRNWQTDEVQDSYTLRDLSGPAGKAVLAEADLVNMFYSFGTSHPGAIVLQNFPRQLQEFLRPDGRYSDLAATDILRTRELGVPRYNEFRRLLHLKPVNDFADLTDDTAMQDTLRELYGDIEDVDTIVGMFAEKQPKGFGFSDTAFRIFVLMATRRLNSDRFLTDDFNEEVYSPAGYRWVVENGMTSVLLRHFPQLRSALREAPNPFAPWRKATD